MSEPTVFPCKNLPRWDWKKGEVFVDNTTSIPFQRNYFDCGIYYFDGTFNVVKFPAGMTIYHGSAMLANGVAEFPVGLSYYTEFDMANPGGNIPIKKSKPELLSVAASSDETIEEIISDSFPISAGWYADPSVATMYSGTKNLVDPLKTLCTGKCINAYVLKEDITMLILDDDYNIAKLLVSPSSVVPDEKKSELKQMFALSGTLPLRTSDDSPFGRLKFLDKARHSSYGWDISFAKWACESLVKPQGYSGYAATTQQTRAHGGSFHLEFIFCNAFKYLKRDLTNAMDWQRKPNVSGVAGEFMTQLGLYETTNVDFHAGNLLEHSIWTLLFAENIVKNNVITRPALISQSKDFVSQLDRFTAFCAFIHDIGKMSRENVKANDTRKKFIFFAIPDHPEIGGQYIMSSGIPIYNKDLVNKGSLTYSDLAFAFNLPYAVNDPWDKIAAAVVRMHWEFGDMLRRFNKTGKTATDADNFGTEFLNKALSIYNPPAGDSAIPQLLTYIYVLLVVSIADIRGALPYGMDRLKTAGSTTIELNKSSEHFPMVTNMPRKYRGGNVRAISDLDGTGVQLANYILGTLIQKLQILK